MNTEEWFSTVKTTLEDAYLTHEEPWRQSGMSGPEERWISLRKPVADCIDKSGSFLDIGCANGYLLECCLTWTAERDIRIEPYGLDISEKLLELAKNRLPRYADNLFIGNAMTWLPPRRFDFVRTELVYVPDEYEKQYIEFILKNHLNPGGKLLVANYGEDLTAQEIEKGILKGSHATTKIIPRLKELGFNPVGYKDGYDPVKGRKVRVAVLPANSHLELRAITPKDLDEVLDVYRQCEDFLALGPEPTASMSMVLNDIEISQREGGVFCSVRNANGKMLGVVDFVPGNFEGIPAPHSFLF